MYSFLQIGHMYDIVDANRDVFGGQWGDWKTHVVTISIVPEAAKDRVAAARAALAAVGSASDPSVDTAKEWRVGFMIAGPSVAELDQVKSKVTTAEPWVKDVGNHLAFWGIDPVYHAVAVGLDMITPTISHDAVSAFGPRVILQTSGRASLA
jgi:thiamine biosynthesis protein ThiC